MYDDGGVPTVYASTVQGYFFFGEGGGVDFPANSNLITVFARLSMVQKSFWDQKDTIKSHFMFVFFVLLSSSDLQSMVWYDLN